MENLAVVDLFLPRSRQHARSTCRLRGAHRASEHHHTPGSDTDTRDPAKPVAHRDRLFQQDEASQAGNPKQVHDAAEEQKAHQEPAASQTIGAMLEPHVEGTEWAEPPLLGKKAQGRAAMSQADAL